MKSKCETSASWRLARCPVVFVFALIVLSCTVMSGCDSKQNGQKTSTVPAPSTPVPNAAESNRPARPDAVSQDLQEIGRKVAKAVLAKDIKALLTYDRADLRAEDEKSLRDTTSALYLYIFYTGSYREDEGRSVFDILSGAHELEIKSAVMKSSVNGKVYGTLIFYDRTQILEKSLESDDFLCKEQERKLVSWSFELVNGKWNAVTPFFDYETEGLCPE
jgi:hypothetical protein